MARRAGSEGRQGCGAETASLPLHLSRLLAGEGEADEGLAFYTFSHFRLFSERKKASMILMFWIASLMP